MKYSSIATTERVFVIVKHEIPKENIRIVRNSDTDYTDYISEITEIFDISDISIQQFKIQF